MSRKLVPLCAVVTVSVAVLAACGSNSLKPGPGAIAYASPPPFNTFQSTIEPILENKTAVAGGCGLGGCHDITTHSNNLVLVTASPVSAADVQKNYQHLTCQSHLDSYQPPAGPFVNYFCLIGPPLTVNTSGTHQGSGGRTVLSSNDCIALVNWVQSGGASGSIPQCPQEF